MYRYGDRFVEDIFDDIGRLILDESGDRDDIFDRLCDLTTANSHTVNRYWESTERGRGIPDAVFKTEPPYLFADETPARTFLTSGTTGSARGSACYSTRGMELMKLSILASARRHIMAGLERPAVIRLVPSEHAAPEMVMAYGMELIARTFGDPHLSAVVVGPGSVDYGLLAATLERTIRAGVPAVLLGGSLAFYNVCAELERRGTRYALPPGSRIVDAGGFKGVSKAVDLDALRAALTRTFGVYGHRLVNLFGMTELASQLYDCSPVAVGPRGERPKGGLAFVEPQVLDPRTMHPTGDGPGLLAVVDLCVIDRPPAVLTGDRALGTPDGVAITGRVERGRHRGCSLPLDAITAPGPARG